MIIGKAKVEDRVAKWLRQTIKNEIFCAREAVNFVVD
jgi:hypothetical protein